MPIWIVVFELESTDAVLVVFIVVGAVDAGIFEKFVLSVAKPQVLALIDEDVFVPV